MVEVAPVQHQVEGEDHDAEDRAAEHRELPAQLHVRRQRGPAAQQLPARSALPRPGLGQRSFNFWGRSLAPPGPLPAAAHREKFPPAGKLLRVSSRDGPKSPKFPRSGCAQAPAPPARETPRVSGSGAGFPPPPRLVISEQRSEGRRCGTNPRCTPAALLRSPGLPLSGAEVRRRRLLARAPPPRTTDLATGTASHAH